MSAQIPSSTEGGTSLPVFYRFSRMRGSPDDRFIIVNPFALDQRRCVFADNEHVPTMTLELGRYHSGTTMTGAESTMLFPQHTSSRASPAGNIHTPRRAKI